MSADALASASARGWRAWLIDPERRKRVTTMGTAGALSYLLVKVLKHVALTSVAWYLVALRTGHSPRQHWPTFLSAYASLYVTIYPLQPAKYALVLALAPAARRVIDRVRVWLRVSRGRAVALVLAWGAIVIAALWALMISMAGLLAGVPLR